MKRLILLFFATWQTVTAARTNEVVFADFEGSGWGDWEAKGDAFGPGPARGALPGQQPVTGFLGKGFVSSFFGGDKATGTLTSPEFTISQPYLNFLIGGGNHPGEAGINLLIDGKVTYSATGSEFERLTWHTWQLFPVMTKKARLQIVDQHTGAWGHVSIDHITLSEEPKVIPYANDPITRAMASLKDATPRAEQDRTRPVYHFLAPANWMNDPNGPIYFQGYYHLYYQNNPFGDRWGHIHWGHARSRDLVYWKHLPIALWPSKEAGEDHVFSGCTTTNSAGELLAFYTSIGRKSATDYAEQWAARSDGAGNTFVKHPANPLLTEKLHGQVKVYDWRDPFIFRHQGQVYMVCGGNLNHAQGGQAVVNLYQAENGALTQWKYRGVLFTHPDAAVKNIECPNFFPLGDRWVLIVSPHSEVQYFTGTFDPVAGKFSSAQRGLMDQSSHYYAPNCMEDPKGRRLLWGWVKGFKDDRGWNGCLTLPRVIILGLDGHLRQSPAPELQKLRGPRRDLSELEIRNATNFVENLKGDALEIAAEFEPTDARRFGLRLRCSADGSRGVSVSCEGDQLEVDGVKARLAAPGKPQKLTLQLFLDKSVLEVYANNQACFTRVIYPDENDLSVALFASGGGVKIKSLAAWPVKGIW